MGKSLRYFSKEIPEFRVVFSRQVSLSVSFPPELGTTAVNVQMQEEDYGKNKSKVGMRMTSTNNIFAACAPRQMPAFCVIQKVFCEIFCELHLPSRSQKMRFRG